MNFDVLKIREHFPILKEKVYKKPLIYFDNAATTQKPVEVINCISELYSKYNSNIHRGFHYLSDIMTTKYEEARKTIQKFINANYSHEIIFTYGTTSSINLVAFSFGEAFIKEDDEIIISAMEHHSNIVPWQMVCERKKAKLKVLPFNEEGILKIDKLEKIISEKTKIISITHASNVLGTINPVKEIIQIAHKYNIPVLIDAAQSIQHISIDVQDLDCDFLVFSGHKIYGPNGIGILYGKEKWLDAMPPYMGGGDMIDTVTFEKTTYTNLPLKFEAGTTNYIGAIALAEAINFINNISLEKINQYEQNLLNYAIEKLKQIEGLTIYGNAPDKAPLISFLIDGIHSLDTGMILDKMGIAVRTGTLCAQPIMDFYNLTSMVRASFAFYNTIEEIDAFYNALIKVKSLF